MNRLVYFTGIVLILFLAACEKDDSTGIPPDPVSDVEVNAGYGEVMLTWTNPSTEGFYYVDINFTDSKGTERSEKVSHYASGDTIPGFANTDTYDFTLTAYNYSGQPSDPVSVSVNPLQPPFSIVSSTIDMVPDFGGAIVSWENETGKPVSVNVTYKGNEGEKVSSTFSSDEDAQGYISGLNANERTFEVVVTDEADNSSEPQSFVITPLAEQMIDKSQWSVVDFSTEEPNEGGNPNGLVRAAFDGDYSTFWHTQWAGGSPGYPHYFVIDMGQEVTISRFETVRRQGDDRGQTQIQFLTSLDGETWEDFGLLEVDSSTDDPQSYRLTSNPKARYFKYVATEGPNFFAFLGEITVYGSLE
ncbi:F5/8 type C domain-containing protein [Tangfeifania diversioriginum]|uniref:F5/8 type C domain-containing protein n=1 Tax=Tangfeifania diversioriginum TaxID=1168035 RepID=A0A1M6J8J2_9BACT|nr:DUF4959 domain-containing protein [Tangfeifania diversioriginum]SHJ43026.1 F5/8 type C domain-containing protein [Tangfeifania diversioriginum]